MPGTCAAAYAARLESIAADLGVQLQASYKRLRTADDRLPGRWIYAETAETGVQSALRRRQAATAVASTPRSAAAVGRTCIELTVDRRGREACTAWSTRQPGDAGRMAESAAAVDAGTGSSATFRPAPLGFTRSETELRRAVAGVVKARGAIPEVGPSGRLQWVTQRITTDLHAYVSQPAHPALCTGVTDMLAFYETNLKGLQKRVREAWALAQQGRAHAAARLPAFASVTATGEVDAAGREKAMGSLVQTASLADPKGSGTVAADLPGQDDRHGPAVYAKLAEAAALSVHGREAATLVASFAGVQELQRLASQPIVERGPDAARVRERARNALAVVEAGHYAERVAASYADLDRAVFGAISAIRAAHAEACTCGH